MILGYLRSAPVGVVLGDGRAPAGAGRGSSCAIRRSRACRHSSASTSTTRRSTAAGCRSTSNLCAKDDADASSVIRRLQPALAKVEGITLFMQPVQDLSVETQVSRTQFQYTLQNGNATELAAWAPRFLDRLSALPMLRDVASDQLNEGQQARRRHRSGHGSPSRHHAADARQRAVRCVWPATDFHDVHSVEPVPGRPRDRPVVSTRPGRPPARLSAVGGRRSDSLECLHAHRDGDGAAIDQPPGGSSRS